MSCSGHRVGSKQSQNSYLDRTALLLMFQAFDNIRNNRILLLNYQKLLDPRRDLPTGHHLEGEERCLFLGEWLLATVRNDSFPSCFLNVYLSFVSQESISSRHFPFGPMPPLTF